MYILIYHVRLQYTNDIYIYIYFIYMYIYTCRVCIYGDVSFMFFMGMWTQGATMGKKRELAPKYLIMKPAFEGVHCH